MKKTLNNIFDEANANEIENLVNQNAVPEVSAEILSSIKNKVYAKTIISYPKKNVSFARRWKVYAAAAACLLLIIGAVIAVSMLRDSGNKPIIDPHNAIPSIPTITDGDRITGKQEIEYGNKHSGSDFASSDYISDLRFYVGAVVEVEVLEVLPDTYYNPEHYSQPLHIARLRVVDSIIGEGIPEEIYLYYDKYTTAVFNGYDRFIMSLTQVGVENYMLGNRTQSRADYFPNMYKICYSNDLKYGCVVAFNNGIVDELFWKQSLISEWHPVGHENTLEQAKDNILEYAYSGVKRYKCDYATADDIFVTEKYKEVQKQLAPSPTNVFMHTMYFTGKRVAAKYTRVVNGFVTDEVIYVNAYNNLNGDVARYGSEYTAADLAKVPDIGGAIAELKLFEMKPPHIEITEKMKLEYVYTTGTYRKVDGELYGIIRIIWRYSYPGSVIQWDDLYYLYDSDGNGFIVERDELKKLIGKDSFIQSFSYSKYLIVA